MERNCRRRRDLRVLKLRNLCSDFVNFDILAGASEMGSGSKQPLLVGRSYSMQVQQLCMVLLVMLLLVCFSMIVSVEAAASSSLSSSRKMAAMDQCAQLQHHNIGLLKPRHEFKSVVTDWVMELVKPLICYQRQHVVHHHRCYGRQW